MYGPIRDGCPKESKSSADVLSYSSVTFPKTQFDVVCPGGAASICQAERPVFILVRIPRLCGTAVLVFAQQVRHSGFFRRSVRRVGGSDYLRAPGGADSYACPLFGVSMRRIN